MPYTLLIKNCGQILTMKGESPKRGKEMSNIGMIKDGFVACEGDKIVRVGRMKELKKAEVSKQIFGKTRIIDANGKVVMPGLIDCHTHLVFAGNRADEFKQRLSGESYLDILADGGGILNTVKLTRKASKNELLKNALKHLNDFLSFGVTTVEAKTGYGLDLKNELKILEVTHEAGKRQPVRLVPTFLGAHAVPAEFRDDPRGYLRFLMQEVLPKIQGKVEFVDIFCEKKVFSAWQSKKYLKFAKKLGFKLKIHGEQISRLGACKMAGKLGAVSCDHCDHMTDRDIKKLSKMNTVCVLLPLVRLFLKEDGCADGRKMIDFGLPIAVATDFNPGTAPSKNIFLAMSLACLEMGLSFEEVLTAVTINAASALNLSDKIGSLEKGKMADIAIFDADDYKEIPYWLGENLVKEVIIGGKVVKGN